MSLRKGRKRGQHNRSRKKATGTEPEHGRANISVAAVLGLHELGSGRRDENIHRNWSNPRERFQRILAYQERGQCVKPYYEF